MWNSRALFINGVVERKTIAKRLPMQNDTTNQNVGRRPLIDGSRPDNY